MQLVKNLSANARDGRCRFDPWLGKTPYGRKWQPSPIKFLPGKSMHRGDWRATVHGVARVRHDNPTINKMESQLGIF